MVRTDTHEISTQGQGDARDLTSVVARVVAESGARSGIATTFVAGSTAGMTTLEFEPGVAHDIDAALGVIAPRDGDYRHHLRWGDDNGSSRRTSGVDWSVRCRAIRRRQTDARHVAANRSPGVRHGGKTPADRDSNHRRVSNTKIHEEHEGPRIFLFPYFILIRLPLDSDRC